MFIDLYIHNGYIRLMKTREKKIIKYLQLLDQSYQLGIHSADDCTQAVVKIDSVSDEFLDFLIKSVKTLIAT